MTVKKRQGRKGIETHEILQWTFFTIIYVIFIMIIGGFVKQLDDVYTVGGIALDVQEGFYTLALMLWTFITVVLGISYNAD